MCVFRKSKSKDIYKCLNAAQCQHHCYPKSLFGLKALTFILSPREGSGFGMGYIAARHALSL